MNKTPADQQDIFCPNCCNDIILRLKSAMKTLSLTKQSFGIFLIIAILFQKETLQEHTKSLVVLLSYCVDAKTKFL